MCYVDLRDNESNFPFLQEIWILCLRENNSPCVGTAGYGWFPNDLCRGQNSFFAIHIVGTEQGSVQTLYLQLWVCVLGRQGLNEQLWPRNLEAHNLHHTFVLWGFIKYQSGWWENILFIHLFVWVFLPSNQQAVLPFITAGVFFYFKFWKLRNEADHDYLIKSLANPATNCMWCVCVCESVIMWNTHKNILILRNVWQLDANILYFGYNLGIATLQRPYGGIAATYVPHIWSDT